MRRRLELALAAALLVAPAGAQEARPDYRRALAAGYKAAFLCSDLFNAGLPEAVVEQDDLARIYPELEPLFDELPAEVDRANRRVTVRYRADMPARVAQWRPHLGCAQVPIGAPVENASRLPRLDRPQLDLARLDARPWPSGDRAAASRFRGDRSALDRAVAAAFDRRTYGQGSETTAVLVVQDAASSPSATAPTSPAIPASAPGPSPRASPERS